MDDAIIAALLALVIIILVRRSEGYKIDKTFNSRFADIATLPNLNFTPSDYNQTDTPLDPTAANRLAQARARA
jgi:hypothetical protein